MSILRHFYLNEFASLRTNKTENEKKADSRTKECDKRDKANKEIFQYNFLFSFL